MNERTAAFQASVHGIRTVGGRKCIQIILEAPIEQQAEIARICEHDAWVAVARIQKVEKKETNGKEKRKWDEIPPASQAGILCTDPDFQEYMNSPNDEPLTVQRIYAECGIQSRSQLSTNKDASVIWKDIVTNYRIWQQARA